MLSKNLELFLIFERFDIDYVDMEAGKSFILGSWNAVCLRQQLYQNPHSDAFEHLNVRSGTLKPDFVTRTAEVSRGALPSHLEALIASKETFKHHYPKVQAQFEN